MKRIQQPVYDLWMKDRIANRFDGFSFLFVDTVYGSKRRRKGDTP